MSSNLINLWFVHIHQGWRGGEYIFIFGWTISLVALQVDCFKNLGDVATIFMVLGDLSISVHSCNFILIERWWGKISVWAILYSLYKNLTWLLVIAKKMLPHWHWYTIHQKRNLLGTLCTVYKTPWPLCMQNNKTPLTFYINPCLHLMFLKNTATFIAKPKDQIPGRWQTWCNSEVCYWRPLPHGRY